MPSTPQNTYVCTVELLYAILNEILMGKNLPQATTNYTPYFLMFNRHPHMVEVLNIKHKSEADSFILDNPEVGIDARIAEVTTQRAEVISV